MKPNPVIHHSLIVRSQIEYSTDAQAIIVRCILEMPATGQRQGFTDIEGLLVALRSELLDVQNHLLPSGEEKREK